MKVTDVEAIVLKQDEIRPIPDGTQDALIIKVYTDEGIVGIGEVDSSPYVAKSIIEAPRSHSICCGLRQLVVGEDPFDIERIWEKMYRGSIYYGRRGVAIHAMSGIDIALWDIIGKALGKPVYQLLGGGYREKIRAYASTLMPATPAEVACQVERRVGEGFTAIKLGWGGIGDDIKHNEALLRAARDAAGDEVEILLDVGMRWDAATAIQMVRRWEPYRPFWVEEPLLPDDLDGYARLADAVDTRIAAGEEDSTCYAFRDLMDRGRVDVVQPDVTRAGGLTECRRIAAMAHLRHLPCVPHAWSTGIIVAASLHLNASIPNYLFQEFCVADTPLNKYLVKEPFWIDRDGFLAVPQRPGLGIELDQEVMERYIVGR